MTSQVTYQQQWGACYRGRAPQKQQKAPNCSTHYTSPRTDRTCTSKNTTSTFSMSDPSSKLSQKFDSAKLLPQIKPVWSKSRKNPLFMKSCKLFALCAQIFLRVALFFYQKLIPHRMTWNPTTSSVEKCFWKSTNLRPVSWRQRLSCNLERKVACLRVPDGRDRMFCAKTSQMYRCLHTCYYFLPQKTEAKPALSERLLAYFRKCK